MIQLLFRAVLDAVLLDAKCDSTYHILIPVHFTTPL
jgi:hypothetical protein